MILKLTICHLLNSANTSAIISLLCCRIIRTEQSGFVYARFLIICITHFARISFIIFFPFFIVFDVFRWLWTELSPIQNTSLLMIPERWAHYCIIVYRGGRTLTPSQPVRMTHVGYPLLFPKLCTQPTENLN